MMDDSVILISSDESSRPQSPIEENNLKCEVKSDIESDDTIDYLPPVNFNVDANIKEDFKSNSQDVATESQTIPCGQPFSKNKFHSLSESEESDCEMAVIVEKKQNGECIDRKSSSQQSSDDVSEEKNKRPRKKKGANADREEKARKKAEALELRTKKRALQAKEKAAKKLAAEVHRSMKPGECMKYMQVHLDSRLLSAEFGGELLNGLQAAEVQYLIKDQEVPFSITWTRKVLEPHVDDDLKMEMASRHEEETEALLVCLCHEALDLIHENKLIHHVKAAQQKLHGKNLTLIIYGAEQYFRFQKTSKRKEVRSQVLGTTEAQSKSNKTNQKFESAPKVSREDWEKALAELQLFAECSHRLLDQPQAMGLFVRQFTKAVAERPFKLEKQRREQEQLQWFAAGDSRDCVRIDKDGNGIQRLWQQQLSQFSRVGMEISEAIVSVYKTPRALVEAYENCLTQEEGEQLLASIPVRRGVGPLTTVRRVGPDLSRKLYTFFTAIDGDALLNHE